MKTTDQSAMTLTSTKRSHVASTLMVVAASIVLLVPAADNYHDTRTTRIALQQSVRELRHDGDEYEQLQRKLAQRQATYASWQQRAVATENAEELQDELIATARRLECQVRHASLGHAHRQPWQEGMDPYSSGDWSQTHPNSSQAADSIMLANQSFRITLVGEYDDVRRFITHIYSLDRLLTVKSLELHPAQGDEQLIQLELDIMMFNLEEPHPIGSSTTSEHRRA